MRAENDRSSKRAIDVKPKVILPSDWDYFFYGIKCPFDYGSCCGSYKKGKFTLLKVENDAATLQVDECYFCSGLPVVQRRVCFYDVGMLSGVLTTALEAEFEIKETKCNCMGDKVCEYEVRRI